MRPVVVQPRLGVGIQVITHRHHTWTVTIVEQCTADMLWARFVMIMTVRR